MKKVIKKKGLFNQAVPYPVVFRVENRELSPFEQKKLDEANFHLKKMKSIPK
jgi:hypothetical protein